MSGGSPTAGLGDSGSTGAGCADTSAPFPLSQRRDDIGLESDRSTSDGLPSIESAEGGATITVSTTSSVDPPPTSDGLPSIESAEGGAMITVSTTSSVDPPPTTSGATDPSRLAQEWCICHRALRRPQSPLSLRHFPRLSFSHWRWASGVLDLAELTMEDNDDGSIASLPPSLSGSYTDGLWACCIRWSSTWRTSTMAPLPLTLPRFGQLRFRALVALALGSTSLPFLLVHLSLSSPSAHPHHHLRLRSACRTGSSSPCNIPFDRVIIDLELHRDNDEWECLAAAGLHAPRFEAALIPEDYIDIGAIDGSDYINNTVKLNMTRRVEVLFLKIDVVRADVRIIFSEHERSS
uniref:Uncharacterized protein n=1 Tax=Oryza punctata TaxID=4537 RepID=A0A0E0JYR9_ORYPU